jgi:small subunit ribosomal protein S6
MVKEVERRIRVTDGVVKLMTVRVDEEMKKADRRRARRAAEDAKRRERGHVPAPRPAAAAESEEVGL